LIEYFYGGLRIVAFFFLLICIKEEKTPLLYAAQSLSCGCSKSFAHFLAAESYLFFTET
jgi:hypothetical protein